MHARVVSVLICLACGCTEPSTSSSKADPPTDEKPPVQAKSKVETNTEPEPQPSSSHDSQDGFFTAEGAPDPHACKLASDCLGDTIPDIEQPCCQNPYTLEPYSRPYRKWLGDWRAKNCGGVTCPPPPAPSMPPNCAFEVECRAGVCVDSCP